MEPLLFLEFKASYRRDAIMPTRMVRYVNPVIKTWRRPRRLLPNTDMRKRIAKNSASVMIKDKFAFPSSANSGALISSVDDRSWLAAFPISVWTVLQKGWFEIVGWYFSSPKLECELIRRRYYTGTNWKELSGARNPETCFFIFPRAKIFWC